MKRQIGRIGAISGALAAMALGCGGAASGTRPASEQARAQQAAARFVEVDPQASPRCARTRPDVGPIGLPDERQGAGVALARSRDGARTFAYVADADQDAIHTFDVERLQEIAVTPLAGAPTEVLALADGRVAVSLRDANRVALLEPRGDDEPLELRCSARVAAEPVGLAVSPNGDLAVASGWGHALTLLDTKALETKRIVDLPRDPRSVVFDTSGERAFVSHVVGGRLSVVDLASAARRDVDLRVSRRSARGDGAAPRDGVQGFALASGIVRGQARIFAPNVSVDSGPPVASSSYGGSPTMQIEAPIILVVDPASERPLIGGDHAAPSTSSCILPRSAALLDDSLFVSCLGTNRVLELEANAADPFAVEVRFFDVPAGPTALATDASQRLLVVWSEFAHALTVIELGREKFTTLAALRKDDRAFDPRVERGRALFHATGDFRISKDGRACASCHPDGREDGLTWSTPDGPRQTPMLAGRVAASAPYGWFGKHPTLASHVQETFHRLGGRGFTNDGDKKDVDALLAYVVSMKPPKREGARFDDSRAALVARGHVLFDDARQGCASCHAGGGADGQRHDVGSGLEVEASLKFDTPSLEFVGGTAPYFHDGRYATLMDVLDAHDQKMGTTVHLGAADKLALAAYLGTL